MGIDHDFIIIVPALNGGKQWKEWVEAYNRQDLKPTETLVIDSGSEDDTVLCAQSAGFRIHSIPKAEFNHAKTRDLAVKLGAASDLVIFLTQDAIFASPSSLRTLVECFADPSIDAAYGRQLPRPEASQIASHARIFNYAAESKTVRLADAARLGHKAIFFSNSFAAYRRTALEKVGGLNFDTIIAEDVILAAKILLTGGSIRYCANATVYHSHEYSVFHEMRRYFDIGVFHHHEPWILERFGKAHGEGIRFVNSELRYLWHQQASKIPSSLIRNAMKFVGYRLGKMEKVFPNRLKRRLSMNGAYWNRAPASGKKNERS